MQKTDIEWCDVTWNPVTGCRRGCEYCYARGIARRFGGWTCDGVKTVENLTKKDPPVLDEPLLIKRSSGKVERAPFPFGFEPTLHLYRLDEPYQRKSQNIFVCSMADLFGPWVPTERSEERRVGKEC